MGEQLLYEINGVKHLLFEIPYHEQNQHKVQKAVELCGAIFQGVKDIKLGGWLTPTIGTARVLVPESKVIEFNKQKF